MKAQKKYYVTPIVKLYLDSLKDGGITNEQMYSNNFVYASAVYADIKYRVENNQTLKISIRGESGMGKSLLGLHLQKYVNTCIKEIKKKKIPEQYKLISSDNIEFMRDVTKIKGPCCMLIDEFNVLGDTGANASTEKSLFEAYNDISGQAGISRIMCTPKANYRYDPQSFIIIDVLSKDEQTKENLCRISYNDPSTHSLEVPIGMGVFNVADILDEDWYEKKYRKKKFERIKFMDTYAIRDVRELEGSVVAMRVFDRLKDTALAFDRKGDLNNLVKVEFQEVVRDMKIFTSLIGTMEATRIITPMLELYQSIDHMKEKINKTNDLDKKTKIANALNHLEKKLKGLLEFHSKYVKLHEKYLKLK